MSQNLSSSVVRVLIANILVRSWMIVMQLFLNMFVWKHTQDLRVVALYNIIYICMHTLTYTLSAPFIKSWNRKIAHVLSLFWYGLVYLYLVISSWSIIEYVYFVAACIGVWNGLYRLTYHTTQFDLTTYGNRWYFEWLKSSLSIWSKLLFPVLYWFIITQDFFWRWYEIVFWIWAVMFFLAGVIWAISPATFSWSPYSLWKLRNKIKNRPRVLRSLITGTSWAIWFSPILLETILPLLLFSFVANEWEVWFLVSLFSFVSIVASYLFWKLVPYSRYGHVLIGVWIVVASLYIWLLMFPSYKWLIIISSLLNFCLIFFSIPQKIISDNVLHSVDWYQDVRPEFVVVRERFLTIGWLSVYLIIYFANDLDIIWLQSVFIVMIICVALSSRSLQKISLTDTE